MNYQKRYLCIRTMQCSLPGELLIAAQSSKHLGRPRRRETAGRAQASLDINAGISRNLLFGSNTGGNMPIVGAR